LATDTIDIWHGNVANEDQHSQRYWCMLDKIEQAHAGKMKNPVLRNRYIGIHGRLRELLGQILNQAPEQIDIKKTVFGKPYLAEDPELVFNLSHSGSTFLIAVANHCQLGVDLEYFKSRVDFPGLVNHCFAEEEILYWSRLPDARKTSEFYRFWTRKEAFAKAVGRGLALGLKQCVVNPEKPDEFLRIPIDYGSAANWRVFDIDLGKDVCSALVADKDIVGVSLRYLE
jgi:4'-phosphopantetheinyl transferase